MSNIDTNGKRLNLFPMKKKKKKVSSNKAFDMMNTVADKSNVDINNMGDIDKSTKGIHNALMAAGMTPAYGNVADLADATLYALEGEFGDAAWSAAAAIPIIGQMVAGKRALKVAKESGEEMVTFYRGVPDWFKGKMVKDGNFVGGKKFIKQVDKPKKSAIKGWGSVSTEFQNPDWQSLNKAGLWVAGSRKYAEGFVKKFPNSKVLEFEVPKSWVNKNFKKTGQFDKGPLGFFNEGLPKEFLKKVHK